jgi:hypothetical protein
MLLPLAQHSFLLYLEFLEFLGRFLAYFPGGSTVKPGRQPDSLRPWL